MNKVNVVLLFHLGSVRSTGCSSSELGESHAVSCRPLRS